MKIMVKGESHIIEKKEGSLNFLSHRKRIEIYFVIMFIIFFIFYSDNIDGQSRYSQSD